MGQFNAMKLTNKGLALFNKVQTGTQLQLTKIAIGDGSLAQGQTLESLTALVNKTQDLAIISTTSNADGTVSVQTTLSNQGTITGKYIREIGLFATDPTEGEILYCVANSGSLADYLPPEGADIIENIINVIAKVGNSSNVTAIIDKSLVFPTVQDFSNYQSTINAQMADIVTLDADFPRISGEITDNQRIQRAIDYIKSTTADSEESTLNVVPVKKDLLLPAGRLIIAETVNVPSFINIKGKGRNTTIFESSITDGSPLIRLDGRLGVTFYNTISGFSIDGKSNNCKGIEIYNAHRWTVDDIFINGTRNNAMYIWEGYIGDVRSVYVRDCGNTGIASVLLDGSSFDNSSHAVNFYGGEIVSSQDAGMYLHFGGGISIFGTTIEGNKGSGIVLKNTISTVITGSYMEANRSNIEIINATALQITGNYFADVRDDLIPITTGHILITKVFGLFVSDNLFGLAPVGGYIISAIGADIDLRFRSSEIRINHCAVMPMTIEPRLVTLAKTTGTIIHTDNSVQRSIYGRPMYVDGIDSDGTISTPLGLISNGETVIGGSGVPAVSANAGSVFMRSDGGFDTVLYTKVVGGTTGYRPIQIINSGTTANRPTVTTAGFMYFDTTLIKPIWWSGATWRDATGLVV